jgi:hypothetical protein
VELRRTRLDATTRCEMKGDKLSILWRYVPARTSAGSWAAGWPWVHHASPGGLGRRRPGPPGGRKGLLQRFPPHFLQELPQEPTAVRGSSVKPDISELLGYPFGNAQRVVALDYARIGQSQRVVVGDAPKAVGERQEILGRPEVALSVIGIFLGLLGPPFRHAFDGFHEQLLDQGNLISDHPYEQASSQPPDLCR